MQNYQLSGKVGFLLLTQLLLLIILFLWETKLKNQKPHSVPTLVWQMLIIVPVKWVKVIIFFLCKQEKPTEVIE
jgi:hypothetical protein